MKIVYIFFFFFWKRYWFRPRLIYVENLSSKSRSNIILLLSLDCAYNVSLHVGVLIKEILVFSTIR